MDGEAPRRVRLAAVVHPVVERGAVAVDASGGELPFAAFAGGSLVPGAQGFKVRRMAQSAKRLEGVELDPGVTGQERGMVGEGEGACGRIDPPGRQPRRRGYG